MRWDLYIATPRARSQLLFFYYHRRSTYTASPARQTPPWDDAEAERMKNKYWMLFLIVFEIIPEKTSCWLFTVSYGSLSFTLTAFISPRRDGFNVFHATMRFECALHTEKCDQIEMQKVVNHSIKNICHIRHRLGNVAWNTRCSFFLGIIRRLIILK